jgi:peptidoglycan/LPS O-acetylase OafA/YrhL
MSRGTAVHSDGATPPGIRPSGPYWPSFDGLRAVAITLVFLFHVWPPLVPGGGTGVDAFFVLSAFLITYLLVREHERSGRIRLGRFYARRALRLLPVLFVVAPVAAAVAWAAIPAMRSDILPAMGSTLLYYANFRAAAHPGHMAVFLPTWSLSTEEQFYLVWPTLLVVLMWARLRGRALAAVALALLAANVVWLQISLDRGTPISVIEYRPDLRATGILVGTTLGLLFAYDRLPRAGRLKAPLTVLTCVALVVIGCYVVHPQLAPVRFRVTVAVAVVCVAWGVVVLQQAVAPLRPLTLLLANPVARWLGRVSYTVYLVHVPVIRTTRVALGHPGPLRLGLVSAVITLAVTAAIHYAIERPALRLKDRRSEPPDAYGVPQQTPRIPAWD